MMRVLDVSREAQRHGVADEPDSLLLKIQQQALPVKTVPTPKSHSNIAKTKNLCKPLHSLSDWFTYIYKPLGRLPKAGQ